MVVAIYKNKCLISIPDADMKKNTSDLGLWLLYYKY